MGSDDVFASSSSPSNTRARLPWLPLAAQTRRDIEAKEFGALEMQLCLSSVAVFPKVEFI